MKRYIRSTKISNTSYPHFYGNYVIYQEDDGMYYICDRIYDEIISGPFHTEGEAEYYIDQYLD